MMDGLRQLRYAKLLVTCTPYRILCEW